MNFNLVEFEASFGTSSQLPKSNMPEIVFAGRSNVGKSSMINKLFNRKQLARVSSTPGKTITINFFRLGEVDSSTARLQLQNAHSGAETLRSLWRTIRLRQAD